MKASTLRVISSMATRDLIAELIAMWQDGGGVPVSCESVGGVDAAKRVAAGEPFEVVVLAADAIDRLIEDGHVVAGTKTDFVRSAIAVAARRGAVHPPIHDEAALRAAVLAAGRIALSTGPSGKAIQALFLRWGIARDLHDRLIQAAPGVPVGALIAAGMADLGFQQLSELQALQGIDVLGPMPPGLEVLTTFSTACCVAGAGGPAVMSLLQSWNSPNAASIKRRHGLIPASA